MDTNLPATPAEKSCESFLRTPSKKTWESFLRACLSDEKAWILGLSPEIDTEFYLDQYTGQICNTEHYHEFVNKEENPSVSDDGKDTQALEQRLLAPPGASLEDKPLYKSHGRPLVEIFAVNANFNFIGTVVVSDKYRSQIVYHHKYIFAGRSPRPGSNVYKQMMSGPSYAISAEAGFLVEVFIPGGTVRGIGCSPDHGEQAWKEFSKYDESDTLTVETHKGRRVDLTFMALSCAVQVTIELKLRLPSSDLFSHHHKVHIHGYITARINTFEHKSVLLNRDAWEALNVGVPKFGKRIIDSTLDDQDSSDAKGLITLVVGPLIKIPLDRSVLAVPVDSRLQIKGELLCGDHVEYVNHVLFVNSTSVKTSWAENNKSCIILSTRTLGQGH